MSNEEKILSISLLINASLGLMTYMINNLITQPTHEAQAIMGILIYLLMSIPVGLTVFCAVNSK